MLRVQSVCMCGVSSEGGLGRGLKGTYGGGKVVCWIWTCPFKSYRTEEWSEFCAPLTSMTGYQLDNSQSLAYDMQPLIPRVRMET
jgi:hypothetical protein